MQGNQEEGKSKGERRDVDERRGDLEDTERYFFSSHTSMARLLPSDEEFHSALALSTNRSRSCDPRMKQGGGRRRNKKSKARGRRTKKQEEQEQ